MSIVTEIFVAVIVYRTICACLDWPPWPVVQITINNHADAPE